MKENWQQVKEIFAETLSQRQESRLQLILAKMQRKS